MRPATRQDVIWIAQTLWERGAIELQHWPRIGGHGIDPLDWLEGWNCRINRGDAVAFGPEGKPHAILGCDWETDDACNTSFQASKSFEGPAGRQVTKEMRRAIPHLMEKHGAKTVNVYSLCISPESERWFRLLGLAEDTNYKGPQCGPFFMRRFFRSL